MVGTTGRHDGGGNYVVALDIETGEEAWRFGTIPGPDEPGGHTWNGLPHVARNGASVWIPGSYDPVNNLALFGTGNTYDTAPLRDAVGPPGTNNDGLYLDATLALNADTGELAWHFQHQANGQWDLDWAFERQIAELPVDGEPTSVVVTVGKQAIFDFVEAATGRYVSSLDLGLQTGITAIDPVTGRKTQDPRLIPGDGETKRLCPHVGRREELGPDRLRPAHAHRLRADHRGVHGPRPGGRGERGSLTTGVRWTVRPRPESDGQYSRLEAVNLATGETAWIARQRAHRPPAPSPRRRTRLRRLARPPHQRLRRRHRRPAVGDAPQRGPERPAHHLRGRRAAVRGRHRRQRRLSDARLLRARPGDPQPARPGRGAVGLRPAGTGRGRRRRTVAIGRMVTGSGERTLRSSVLSAWRCPEPITR